MTSRRGSKAFLMESCGDSYEADLLIFFLDLRFLLLFCAVGVLNIDPVFI